MIAMQADGASICPLFSRLAFTGGQAITLLMCAASEGHCRAVELLTDAGTLQLTDSAIQFKGRIDAISFGNLAVLSSHPVIRYDDFPITGTRIPSTPAAHC